MSRLPNEDLFEGSKMSFGEHLEELRLRLFRALLGVAVGVVFGFVYLGGFQWWLMVHKYRQWFPTMDRFAKNNQSYA